MYPTAAAVRKGPNGIGVEEFTFLTVIPIKAVKDPISEEKKSTKTTRTDL